MLNFFPLEKKLIITGFSRLETYIQLVFTQNMATPISVTSSYQLQTF